MQFSDRLVILDSAHLSATAYETVSALSSNAMPDRSMAARDRRPAVELGSQLFDCILSAQPPSTGESLPYQRLLIRAEKKLSSLPWELLHNGEQFISEQADTVIFRYVPVTPSNPLQILQSPIRMLLTTNTSEKRSVQDTKAEESWVRQLEHDSQGAIRLTILREPTRLRFLQTLSAAETHRDPFHLWHHFGTFIGTTTANLSLKFSDQPESTDTLGELLKRLPNLHLVTINADFLDKYHDGPLALPVPALVTTYRPVDPLVSATFFGEFYRTVFLHGLSQAIQQARQAAFQVALGSEAWAYIAATVQRSEDALVPIEPSKTGASTIMASPHFARDQVFISYSHRDKEWFKSLVDYLQPLRKTHVINGWTDEDIKPGQNWFDAIIEARNRAKVVVFLASPSALSSDFILEHELRPLLELVDQKQVTLLWLPLTAYSYRLTILKNYQAVQDPAKPLDRLSQSDQQDVFVKVIELVADILNNG